ncbi:MAG: formylglycine-generating enzyme family protein [Bacteroidales bacterium]|jgi:formylglycine-generating enzyme required for sulfatase activity|nr:formylglycine-generating enzyme family protein [Bacteroidales bacterium]
MRKLNLFVSLLLTLLLLGILVSASPSKKPLPTILETNQRFVKIENNLYVDKYEVSVGDYHIFLNDKKGKGEDCTLLMYDSTLWDLIKGYGWEEYYFNHRTSAEHPIICITYTAANEFCKWLTEKYNTNSQKKYKKVIFRLPSEQEFIKAAISHYDRDKIFYPWGTNFLFNSKGEKLCSFWEIHQEDLDVHDSIIKCYNIINFLDAKRLENVASYKPNPYGIFNIVGNVAEMIQEENIAMGGDWRSTGYNVKITSKKKFENADISVGFRVYMEVIEF